MRGPETPAVRIAHILPYDATQPGGVQTHLFALDRQLRRLGHESVVFAPQHPLRARLGDTNADLTLHPSDLLGLRQFLKRPADVLHIQEPLLPLFGPLALFHPSRPPTVVTLHSAEPAAERLYRRAAPFTRRILARAQAIVCATRVTLDTAAPGLPQPITIIPPGLDLKPFQSVTRRSSEHQSLLFVGRDEPRKGLSVLIDALAQLPTDISLTVAGPVRAATVRRVTQHGLAHRVRFLGPVDHDRLPALLAAATFAVFPSIGGEALGLVLIEAMSAGAPIIASDIPGYRVASRDGHAAELVVPGDSQALSERITRLLQNDARRRELSARGRAAARRYDVRRVAQQHILLYRRIASAGSRHRLT